MPSSSFMLGPIKCSTVSVPDLLNEIHELLVNRSESPRTINCVNAHIFNLAWEDRDLSEYLNRSRIVTADGMSIVWAARFLGLPIKERCNMTEAFRGFLQDISFPDTTAV